MMKTNLTKALALAAFLCCAVVSCHKDNDGDSEVRAAFMEYYGKLREDRNRGGGVLVPVLESCSRKGSWGYEARFRVENLKGLFALASVEGDIIRTSDNVPYGLAVNSFRVLADDVLVISGSNGNVVEYLSLLAAVGRRESEEELSQVLAFLNSMSRITVSLPDGEELGAVSLAPVRRGTLFAPAFFISLNDGGGPLELDSGMDFISALAAKANDLLEALQ